MKVSRAGIVSKIGSPEAIRVAVEAGKYLSSRGIEVLYSGEAASKAGSKQTPLGEMDADAVVVVGGDGTIMRVAQSIGETPILGIKVGALGFLCETSPEGAQEALERMAAGKFFLEYKTKLKVKYRELKLPPALNEVLVTTNKPTKILSLAVTRDEEPFHRGKADGVIVSTTTGSTAYALSAGGPVIDPRLDVIEVVFICPLTAGIKPTLFPISTKVGIKVLPLGSPGLIVIDGQTTVPVDYEVPITVERSEERAAFVRVSSSDFYKRIRQKIKLGFEI
uniref:NAD kinase n=1 Tax=Candidatus Methanomethylicus mesodigestus TaxID=1867258 RepID=A0A7C3J1P1_9CREN